VTVELAALPFCYLTTTGRRTGVPHRIEIWFGLGKGTVYLLSGGGDRSDWVRNIARSPEVELELGDERRTTTARVLERGSDEDALARELLVRKYRSPDDDLASWGRTSLAVAVDWS
jgi:deazaflavin-dependent oxidoreductase (nitroreductase family)